MTPEPITQADLELLPEEVRHGAENWNANYANGLNDRARKEVFDALIASQKELATANARVAEMEMDLQDEYDDPGGN